MKRFPVPSDDDWRGTECGDPDLIYAYDRFHGRTVEDVVHYFSEWPNGAIECLQCMPPVPFRYYVFALAKFLTSVVDSTDPNVSDAASCFLNLVENKWHRESDSIRPIWVELVQVVNYVSTHQNLFGAPVDIYGDFRDQAARIKSTAI